MQIKLIKKHANNYATNNEKPENLFIIFDRKVSLTLKNPLLMAKRGYEIENKKMKAEFASLSSREEKFNWATTQKLFKVRENYEKSFVCFITYSGIKIH